MKIINKDILSIEEGIIVHQVNCQKIMGAGLARKIREKYPIVYDEYRNTNWNLGKIQLVTIEKNKLYVCNLAGQDSFGKSKYRYTDYDAVRKGFRELNKMVVFFNINIPIYIPYKIGCGLGNGNWNIVNEIIKEEIPNAIICKPLIKKEI